MGNFSPCYLLNKSTCHYLTCDPCYQPLLLTWNFIILIGRAGFRQTEHSREFENNNKKHIHPRKEGWVNLTPDLFLLFRPEPSGFYSPRPNLLVFFWGHPPSLLTTLDRYTSSIHLVILGASKHPLALPNVFLGGRHSLFVGCLLAFMLVPPININFIWID